MNIQLLAETATAPDTLVSGAWVISLVVAVIGALAGGVKIGQSAKVKLTDQPIGVDIADKFLTRSEFLEFKGDIKADVREMKTLYEKSLTLITTVAERSEAQHREGTQNLHDRIAQVTDEGAERRRRIHDKLNEHADLLSRIDARTDVSKSIGRLGGAIMTLAKKEPN